MKFRLFLCLFVSAVYASAQSPAVWPEADRDAKPWTRWWWPGSAVDRENLTRELEAFAAAGFGGVEITPIYGAKGAEKRFIPFLSDEYVAMLAHVTAEAKRLGLGVDMATGTGWPFGGPHVTREDAEQKIEVSGDKLAPRPSGFRVKRAAPGGAGFVVDPYSVAALERYLASFDIAFAKLPAGALRGQFHDSFEYTGTWADELPGAFLAQHGYDVRDHAAELSGKGDPDTLARVKADYRETLAALHLDFVKRWTAWTHERGQIARNQAHGAPGNILDLYAASDIPESEIFGSSVFAVPGYRRAPNEIGIDTVEPLFLRFAPSAAHVSGKKLVSAETFTWLREHFHEAPSQMKPEVDQLFLAGVNHLVYHGTSYSPTDAAWPGWLFYASTQFNERNPLWRDLSEGLNAYIARCQALLQLGQPHNDVLVYWPIHDIWHNPDKWALRLTLHETDWLTKTSTGATARALIDQGVGIDYISDTQLAAAHVRNGMIYTPGASYSTIVVPQTAHMPPATLRALLDLAEAGAFVTFAESLPADVPGAGRLAERRAELAAQLARITLSEPQNGLRRASLGKGEVVVGPLKPVVDAASFSRELLADTGLSFIRRELTDGHLYFIANLTDRSFDDWAHLRHAGKNATLMDARTGRIGQAATRDLKTGQAVHLQLAPGESIFIRTSDSPAVAEPWAYHVAKSPAAPLKAEWKISFISGGPELPSAYTTTELKSWTTQGCEAERFAGTARYQTEFELPAGVEADDWQLDLGDVRETARVFVNGKQVDLLWSLPFRTRIGAHLKPGKNSLAIEVTNLAANRIRDLDARKVPWKNFHEINFVNIHYKPLDASQWTLMPSGLLGPVTLTPLRLSN